MLALIIVLILVVLLISVSTRKGSVERQRDDLKIQMEGRRLAEQLGVPFDEQNPCGHPDCSYPLCVGSYERERMPSWCHLNDDPYPGVMDYD